MTAVYLAEIPAYCPSNPAQDPMPSSEHWAAAHLPSSLFQEVSGHFPNLLAPALSGPSP